MNKVWLMGGFGNVLFQILAFNVLSKKNKNFLFVKQLTEKNKITKFLGWSIHQPLYDDLIDNKKIVSVNFVAFVIIVFTGFLSKKINKGFKLATFYTSHVEMKRDVSKNIFGYFQNKTFLEKNQIFILELGNQLRSQYELENKAHIVVHYRKGDSDWAKKYSRYYDMVKTKLLTESLPITLVTDSKESAMLFFRGVKNVKIVSSENALDDFKFLVSCSKLYCAPSTFSWWAAHSVNKGTSVVLPKFIFDTLGFYNNKCAYEILD